MKNNTGMILGILFSIIITICIIKISWIAFIIWSIIYLMLMKYWTVNSVNYNKKIIMKKIKGV